MVAPIDTDLTWPELVLHVLAHLETTAGLASSLYDEGYVRSARERLGDASERTLGWDVELLGARLVTHEQLSLIQLVARLHPNLDAARRLAELDLASLPASAESDGDVRNVLLARCRIEAELLRCAALLEADTFLRWPLPDLAGLEETLATRLSGFRRVAPELQRLPVRVLRVLGMRGRLWPDMIAVGIPTESGEPSMEHVCWQAAHEATVSEVSGRSRREGRRLSERDIEHLAVALLTRRSSHANAPSGHPRWLERMVPEVIGWSDVATLPDESRAWLDGFSDERLERSP